MLRFLEYLQESSWRKALYHSTNKEFDPAKIRIGSHFGDLGTAVKRADDFAHEGRPQSVMTYSHTPTGKSVRVDDDWYSNTPEHSIAHQLHQKGIISQKVRDFIHLRTRYPQRAMGRFLRQKGISHVKYKNSIEGGGSDSTIVYNPKEIQHKATFKDPNIIRSKKPLPHMADDDAWNRIARRKEVFGTSGRYEEPKRKPKAKKHD